MADGACADFYVHYKGNVANFHIVCLRYFRTFPLFMMFLFSVLFTLNDHVERARVGEVEGECGRECFVGKVTSVAITRSLVLAESPAGRSGAEEPHGAHHVLAADGALGQLLGARGAGGDVPALQQHALQRRRHADLAALFEGKVVDLCNGTQITSRLR